MDDRHASARARIGRPPKVDAAGTPTRARLLRAAVEACVEFGYEGVTLADIARRADVSTPAIYSHFSGKAALLVEASKAELDTISTMRLPGDPGLIDLVRHWLRPDFRTTRILIAELHSASTRQPEVAELLADWQRENAAGLARLADLSPAQVQAYYLVLLGLSHVDSVSGVEVDLDDLVVEVEALLGRWFAGTPDQTDC